MRALFQNVRSGVFGQTPPVLHNIGTVLRGDVFIRINRDNITVFAGIQQLFQFTVDRRVTKNKAGRKFDIGFLMRLENLLAVGDFGCQRLFRKYMFTGGKAG